MYCMFSYCFGLTNIDLSSFDTKNLINMVWIFLGCKYLTNVDLSSFDIKNVTKMENMLKDCKSLKTIKINKETCEKIKDQINQNITNIIYQIKVFKLMD